MDTVQLQCGHCKKVMAIGVEYLGGQVQCPHCKGVVQTPARTATAAPSPPAEVALPGPESEQPESIFTGPVSDTVLGDAQPPQVEMPPSPSVETAAPEPDADLTQFKRRPIYTGSVLTMYAFIFLIPYAILATAAIVYLLVMRPAPVHPLDIMPDPASNPKAGGAKSVSRTPHKQPLADHQRVAIGKSIQIGKDGDLLVTPEKVVWTANGELRLFLRTKNTSSNTIFEPINELFVKYTPTKDISEPYTYVESRAHKFQNIYGAYLGYRKSVDDEEDGPPVPLRPGQETLVVLTTYDSPLLAEIAKGDEGYTWRVQLRRGLVRYRERDVSATAVIGVDFKTSEIEGKRG